MYVPNILYAEKENGKKSVNFGRLKHFEANAQSSYEPMDFRL